MDPMYTGSAAQNQFINKVTVCNYAADTIPTCPNVNDLSKFVGYTANVTDDPTTVLTAKAAINQL